MKKNSLMKVVKTLVTGSFLFLAIVLPFQNCGSGFQSTNQLTSASAQGAGTAIPAGTTTVNAMIAWDKITDATLSGYRVYVGTESGVYTLNYDVGMTANADLPQ